jgi:hypothetical protein
MALVNPNIAMSYRPTVEYQPRNALADAAQIQNLVSGQRQAEVADMQLEQLRRDRDALSQIQAAIVAKGGPPDLAAAADAMIKSGKPEYLTQGMAIRQKLKDQEAFSAYEAELRPKAPAASPIAEPFTFSADSAQRRASALGRCRAQLGSASRTAKPCAAPGARRGRRPGRAGYPR